MPSLLSIVKLNKAAFIKEYLLLASKLFPTVKHFPVFRRINKVA